MEKKILFCLFLFSFCRFHLFWRCFFWDFFTSLRRADFTFEASYVANIFYDLPWIVGWFSPLQLLGKKLGKFLNSKSTSCASNCIRLFSSESCHQVRMTTPSILYTRFITFCDSLRDFYCIPVHEELGSLSCLRRDFDICYEFCIHK